MLQHSTEILAQGGLNSLWSNLLTGWVGPIFIAAVAVFAIVFIKDRAWMKLVSFVGIAAIVGLLVFFGSDLFGKGGKFTSVAKNQANQINTVVVPGASMDFLAD